MGTNSVYKSAKDEKETSKRMKKQSTLEAVKEKSKLEENEGD